MGLLESEKKGGDGLKSEETPMLSFPICTSDFF